MKKLSIRKPLPWAPEAVHGMVMNATLFPSIYSDFVKSATLTETGKVNRTLEIAFNQKAGDAIRRPPLVLHITGEAPHHIHATRHSGEFADLKLDLRLQPSVTDGTDLELSVEYETGNGDEGDKNFRHTVTETIGEILTLFEHHAAEVMAQPPEEEPIPVRKKMRARECALTS